MYSAINIVKTIILISAFVLAATTARALNPPPNGGYPNANTAEGEDALFSLSTGSNNTAIGFEALYSNTTGISLHTAAWTKCLPL
jgi:trimeric autotransporter adhesin